MKNKTLWMVLITMVIILSLGQASIASSVVSTKKVPVTYRGIQVLVEGKKIAGEEPFILDHAGIVMVPVRTIAEAIGKSVEWDPQKNMVYIGTSNFSGQKAGSPTTTEQRKKGEIISVAYRGIRIFAGGKIIQSEEPFIIEKKGIVMVPIRAISEAVGRAVVWDPKNNTVEIRPASSALTQTKPSNFVWLEDMMVLRNVGPFFRQEEPFSIAAGNHNRGLGVRMTGGSAEVVIRTHGKYKAIEGWLGVDDETRNSSGAFFFSIFTDNKEVPSIIQVEGGAEKIMESNPDYELIETNGDEEEEEDNIHKTRYSVNSDLYEKTPVFLSGPILPASYPKYISPVVTDISGALTVTLKITWVEGEPGDYADLTAVLADFKFIKE